MVQVSQQEKEWVWWEWNPDNCIVFLEKHQRVSSSLVLTHDILFLSEIACPLCAFTCFLFLLYVPVLWVELHLSKDILSFQPLVHMNVSVLENKVKVKWDHTELGWALNLMTAILIRSCKKHSREGHMVVEAENGVTNSEAKEYPEPPKPEEVRKHPSLQASEGAWPWEHLDFRLLGSRNVRHGFLLFCVIQFTVLFKATLGNWYQHHGVSDLGWLMRFFLPEILSSFVFHVSLTASKWTTL